VRSSRCFPKRLRETSATARRTTRPTRAIQRSRQSRSRHLRRDRGLRRRHPRRKRDAAPLASAPSTPALASPLDSAASSCASIAAIWCSSKFLAPQRTQRVKQVSGIRPENLRAHYAQPNLVLQQVRGLEARQNSALSASGNEVTARLTKQAYAHYFEATCRHVSGSHNTWHRCRLNRPSYGAR